MSNVRERYETCGLRRIVGVYEHTKMPIFWTCDEPAVARRDGSFICSYHNRLFDEMDSKRASRQAPAERGRIAP